MSRRLTGTRRRRAARGSASVFVVGMAVTLLACAGLVVDGGTAINARMKLADDTEQAARLGAEQIDLPLLRSGGVVRIDASAARSAAGGYLQSLGYEDIDVQVSPAGDAVTAAARDSGRTQLISLIGINSFHVSASATSNARTQ
jgi:NAD/NADP transhydrogenase alpha subunit